MMSVLMCSSVLLVVLTRFVPTIGNNCLLSTQPCTCCKSGYVGDDCSTICSNCERSLYSNVCIDECRAGFYGKYCNLTCSSKCVDGSKGEPICEKRDGFCSYGCKTGYFGRQCNDECSKACLHKQCNQGDGKCYKCTDMHFHGNFCNETCSSGCNNRTCEVNGTCISGCETGVYGAECSMECGNNCNNHHCTGSRADGFSCVDGCKDGYTLKDCTSKCPEHCRTCHQYTSRCTSCEHGFVTHCDNEDCRNSNFSCKQVPTSKPWWILYILAVTALVITLIVVCVKYGRLRVQQYHLVQQVDETMHKACQVGNLDIVKTIVTSKRQSINMRGKRGMTPVMEATEYEQRKITEFLVDQGCDLTLKNEDNDTVLHIACYKNNVEIVKILLEKIFDINIKGAFGRTPIMIAVYKGYRELFDILRAEKGCDLSTTDDLGNSVLANACQDNKYDFVIYLLGLELFDINIRGCCRKTPVLIAAQHGYREVFDVLKDNGCDMKVHDERGDSVLHSACYSDNNVEFVKYLLTLEICDINSKGHKGRTPVMIAARYGCQRVFDFLKDIPTCDLQGKDAEGETVFGLACYDDNVDFVRYLLALNVFDINTRGMNGRTPLMTAAKHGSRTIFDLLVEKGCDTSLRDDNKDTCITLAVKFGDEAFSKYVKEKFSECLEGPQLRLQQIDLAKDGPRLSTLSVL